MYQLHPASTNELTHIEVWQRVSKKLGNDFLRTLPQAEAHQIAHTMTKAVELTEMSVSHLSWLAHKGAPLSRCCACLHNSRVCVVLWLLQARGVML
jgi:hypothetical protein